MSLEAIVSSQFKTTPWDHQYREFEISSDMPSRALFWQMRTGKTKIILDTASHLYREGKIDTLLIFAPNGVHANWVERELPVHLWDSVPVRPLAWRSRIASVRAGKRLSKANKLLWDEAHADWWGRFNDQLTTRDLSVVTFNSESMTREDVRKAIAKLAAKRKVMGVWDESTDFRTADSSRTLMSRHLARRLDYRRILDGTSATNSPLHWFSQFELLEKRCLGWSNYSSRYHKETKEWVRGFKDRYAVWEQRRGAGGRSYAALKEFVHLDELSYRAAPYASVVLRADCSDLPPIKQELIRLQLTPTQQRVYREVSEETEVMVAAGQIVTLKQATQRLNKLQQVVGGFLIDGEGVAHTIPGENPKLERLSDEVYFAPGKTIVWCQFQWEIDTVVQRLEDDGWEVMQYHGRVSDEDKARVRAEFNESETVKAVVCQPQSAGRGIELSGADTIIWYSHTFDAILREQAKERATKMGGGNVRMLDLSAGQVDTYILGKVDAKVSIADDVAGRGLQRILKELQ